MIREKIIRWLFDGVDVSELLTGWTHQDVANYIEDEVQDVINDVFCITTQIVNKSNNPTPVYACNGDAGMDVRAYMEDGQSITLKPGERTLVHTGLYVALPFGYELQVRPRSGLALKKGITVLNTPGTVDAGYRNEIGVIVINESNEDFVINPGERIAQFVFARFVQNQWEEVDELDMSNDRGGGLGHSGVK